MRTPSLCVCVCVCVCLFICGCSFGCRVMFCAVQLGSALCLFVWFFCFFFFFLSVTFLLVQPVDQEALLHTGPLSLLRDAVVSHQQVLINMR